MEKLLLVLGFVAGGLGALLCLGAGLVRLAGGYYYIAGIATGTLFEIGVAMMVFACLVKLHQLTMRRIND